MSKEGIVSVLGCLLNRGTMAASKRLLLILAVVPLCSADKPAVSILAEGTLLQALVVDAAPDAVQIIVHDDKSKKVDGFGVSSKSKIVHAKPKAIQGVDYELKGVQASTLLNLYSEFPLIRVRVRGVKSRLKDAVPTVTAIDVLSAKDH